MVHEDASLTGVTSGSRRRESRDSHNTHDWPAASASEATALRHYTNQIIIIIIIIIIIMGIGESQVVHEESQVVHEDANLTGVTNGSRRRESHGSHKWFGRFNNMTIMIMPATQDTKSDSKTGMWRHNRNGTRSSTLQLLCIKECHCYTFTSTVDGLWQQQHVPLIPSSFRLAVYYTNSVSLTNSYAEESAK